MNKNISSCIINFAFGVAFLIPFYPKSSLAQGTAFTYQGRLSDNGGLANTTYDMRFTLYDTATGPNQIGSAITLAGVVVNEGLFTVTLNSANEFGTSAFNGSARWLKIEVSPAGQNAYVALSARQELTPTPYSIFAAGAANANTVANGSISASQLYTPSGPPSSGQYLTYNNSGNLSWTSLGSASGITLPYSGSLSTAGSLFSLNNTGSGPVATFLGNATLGSTFQEKIQSGANTLALGANSTAAEVQSQGGIPLFINHGGNNVVMADAGPGNVGIATASPNEPLEVAGTGRSFFGDGGGASRKGLLIDGKNDGTYARIEAFSYPSSGLPLAINSVGHGAVGIGTTTPGAPLEVAQSTSGVTTIFGRGSDSHFNVNVLQDNSNNDNGALIGQLGLSYGPSVNSALRFHRGPGTGGGFISLSTGLNQERLRIDGNGNVGIGTMTPSAMLDIRPIAYNTATQSGGIQLGTASDNTHWLSGMFLRSDQNGYARLAFDFDSTETVSVVTGGYVGIDNLYPQSALDVHGETRTCVLTITGGCDVAEPFHVTTQEIARGAIVVIDEDNPGQLKLSESAYDKRVAGIISGANGVNPGLTLSQQGFAEGSDNVALSGRVYALADASFGAIKPGDLLTTSDTPGHCMKVTDSVRAQGAIIGKAMSPLNSGKGMVLVLVSLQ